MTKYRKKPVVIEAIQLNENGTNVDECLEFCGGSQKGNFPERCYGIDPEDGKFKVTTLEGVMIANCGDWLIRGVNGEIYPCKPDIFEKTYEAVEDKCKHHELSSCYDCNDLKDCELVAMESGTKK